MHIALRLADIQSRLLDLEVKPEIVKAILKDTANLVDADAAMAAWLNAGTPFLTTWNTGPQIKEYFSGRSRAWIVTAISGRPIPSWTAST